MDSEAKKVPPLIRLRLEASTSYLSTTKTEPSGIAGGDPELALLLLCRVTKYIKTGRGRGQTIERAYRGSGAEASYTGTVPRDTDTPLDEDSVRVVIRGMLRGIRPLRDLHLTDGEWEAILPEDVVPQLAGLARGLHGDGARAAAVVEIKVDWHVRYNAPRVLFTACREAPAAAGGETEKGGGECSICFEALSGEEEKKGVGVELPGCAHAFHRRCISGWFRKKPTCPLCRGDVTEHLHPELRKHLGDFGHDVFSDDDDDPDIPALLDAPGGVVATEPPSDP